MTRLILVCLLLLVGCGDDTKPACTNNDCNCYREYGYCPCVLDGEECRCEYSLHKKYHDVPREFWENPTGMSSDEKGD